MPEGHFFLPRSRERTGNGAVLQILSHLDMGSIRNFLAQYTVTTERPFKTGCKRMRTYESETASF